MMKSIASVKIAALFATMIGLANIAMPAFAQEQNHIKWSELTKQLEDKGYKIRELDQNIDGFSAEVIDNKNQRIELRIDNKGNITQQRNDD